MHCTLLCVSLIVYYTDPEPLPFNTTVCKKDTNFYIQTPKAAFFWLIINNVVNIILGGVQKVLQERTSSKRMNAKHRFDARHNFGYINMFLQLTMVLLNFYAVIIA